VKIKKIYFTGFSHQNLHVKKDVEKLTQIVRNFILFNDLRCNVDCLRKGDCCDDFEQECKSELNKENCNLCSKCHQGTCKICKEYSTLHNQSNYCKCNAGYLYDPKTDTCEMVYIIFK
jgi:hypothetical protein